MLKIRALNRESSSDEDAPSIRKEAQEEISLDMYNKALKLLSEGHLVESETILIKLITENIPQLENQGGLPKTMSTIKYSCYINLGRILLEKGEINDALEHYLHASKLDNTDVTLWHKIGKLSLKLDKFRQAAYAFSKGLECSEAHWPCLDQLITLLYAIQDTIGCLYYIDRALTLDPYYIKGLVLREHIYKDNRYAKDYYKSFTHEYVIEAYTDITIEDEDKAECLREVSMLCDQINKAEKKLEPEPLPTIALPTPLNDYTWVALGNTLIDLHNYISDNNMSHFAKVDLTRCMSQCMESSPFEELLEEKEQPKEDVNMMENKVEDNSENNKREDNMETESIISRRISQNSDNNGNDTGENVTPVQTDDNEEMEQDIEDGEDNAERIDKNRSQNRGTKRRRDLLSDLQIWGWHSKRKSSKKGGKHERDLTVEDALTRIIPKHLLTCSLTEKKTNNIDDSMNTMDLYNLYIAEKQENVLRLSPIHSPRSQNSENYFASNQEKDDVLKFWTKKRESCDAVCMIEEYIFTISKLWHIKWPPELIKIYLQLYNMFREHCDPPPPFCSEEDIELLKNDSVATLLYGELLQFNPNNDFGKNNVLSMTSLSHLQLVSGWDQKWADEFLVFFIRVHWLRTHFYRRDENNEMAIQALQLVEEELNAEQTKTGEKYILSLPNCKKCNLITTEIIDKILKHLELINSLSQLEQLYDAKEYTKVADILKTTFGSCTSHPSCGRMGRPAQIGMLLHSLWYTDLTECFVWCEECLYESLSHFLTPSHMADKWEMVIQKCLLIMVEIIKKETVSIVDNLTEDKRRRLVETIARIVCHQLNSQNASIIPLGSLIPWIVLHYILLREEHRMQASKKVKRVKKKDKEEIKTDEERYELPASIAVLFSAHQFLGAKGWCITGQGELLHFVLDIILDRLDTPIFEKLRDKIDIHIEQAFFCLYQHPSKKNKMSRHLADHNVDPLRLSWERSHQLYEFYCPDRLPEFDSYRSISISSDLEQLLQRISALVPPECDPQPLLPKITDFVNGVIDELPDPIDFPFKVKAIYYLLGDYYFKQSEVGRSMKYFLLDLCINPLRLDSWACLALAFSSQLESKLNHCERFKTENEFLDKAKSAQVCFKQALKLANEHITLWIEYGSFEYMVHSFCSRLLKYDSVNMSMEKFEVLENVKDSYLTSSKDSFHQALNLYEPDQCEADERWLFHYMLAKIAEKQKQDAVEYLQHYLTASGLLEENNATYPEKINYTNPQHLSLEALEVHYRIHASILKYLELHEGKPILSSIGKIFKKCLNTCTLPKKNYNREQKSVENDSKPEKLITETTETHEQEIHKNEILPEVKECIEDILSKVELLEVMKQESKQEKNVIMISDSDDDKKQIKTESEIEHFEKPKNVNAQDIMDALMQETMNKQDEAMDTDSDVSCITIVPKSEIKEEMGFKHVQKVEVVEDSPIKPETKNEHREQSTDKEEEQNIRKSTDTSSTTSSSSSSSSSSDSDSDDSSSSSSSTSSDSTGNMPESEVLHLVDRCITGLEQCIIRLPQNYKAIYRLAHLYYNYKVKKDLTKCRQLLLGEYKCKNNLTVSGLFSDRKTSNFFNGIWRIPSSEIDRPGSLAAHMSRCVSLLLQVLRSSNDHKTLLDLCLQLKRTPDADKVYIRDAERKQLSDQAMSLCVQSLKSQIKNMNTSSHSAMQKLLIDIFKAYQRVQKHMVAKEGTFATMLTDVYKKIVQENIPDNVSVLDLAIKYCQQNKPVEKPKVQNYNPLPRSAYSANPPVVLPSPSNVLSQSNVPLKRPGIGRPRGRPPGPKLPGQPRSSRGRSPSVSSSTAYWQNQMLQSKTAYDYMKQYQEELIRQYSKTLTMNQLAQIGQYLNQSSYSGQFGASSSLMNTSKMPQNINPALGQVGIGNNLSKTNQNLKTVSAFNLPKSKHDSAQSSSTKLPASTPAAPRISEYNPLNFVSSSSKLPTYSSKNVFTTPSAVAGTSSTGYKYSTGDYGKQLNKGVTKTTSSFQQIFLEATKMAMAARQQQATKPKKEKDKVPKLPNRPNISITPVNPTTVITTNTTKYVNPPPTVPSSSPGKTLQEKLAEKQKQLSTKHGQSENRNPEKIVQQVSTGISNVVLPTSLTISRTSATLPSFPMNSGMSISEIPASKSQQSTTEVKLYRKEQVIKSIPSSSSSHSAHPFKPIHLPVSTSVAQAEAQQLAKNLPISLSVIKKPEDKPERKMSSDDDVIVIE